MCNGGVYYTAYISSEKWAIFVKVHGGSHWVGSDVPSPG
jgi:hypothetical protein